MGLSDSLFMPNYGGSHSTASPTRSPTTQPSWPHLHIITPNEYNMPIVSGIVAEALTSRPDPAIPTDGSIAAFVSSVNQFVAGGDTVRIHGTQYRRSDHFVGGCNTYSDNAIAAVAAVNDSTAYQLKQQPIPNKMQVPQI